MLQFFSFLPLVKNLPEPDAVYNKTEHDYQDGTGHDVNSSNVEAAGGFVD